VLDIAGFSLSAGSRPSFDPPTFQGNRGRFESESLKSLDAVEKLKVLLALNL